MVIHFGSMRIHAPEITVEDGWITVSARVETGKTIPQLPERIEFAYPEACRELLSVRSEPFTLALLLFAMAIDQDLEVAGDFSPRLYYHLERYQQIFHLWLPEKFKRIRLKPDQVREDPAPPGRGAAVLFSGGVDSFYTLQAEINRPEPYLPGRLTHGLFIFFDRKGHRLDLFQHRAELYGKLFESLGLELVPVRTNLRRFVLGDRRRDRDQWVQLTYGAGLAGIAMMLSGGIGHLYLPSGMPVSYYGPDGSQLLIDHLLSTERFEVIHHGIVETRGDKIKAIADWPLTYDLLNVCWWRVNHDMNCGRCPKCVRTLAYLEIFDRKAHYTVFEPSSWLDEIRWFSSSHEVELFSSEIYRLARKRGKTRLALTAGLGIVLARIKSMVLGLMRLFSPGFRR